MAIMNLTEARIRELEYGSGIWRDEQVKGLMLICHATTKSYAVQGDVRRNGRHWTCNGLVPVTCLSLCHLRFESQWAYSTQICVAPSGIVEAVDVAIDRSFCLTARGPALPPDELSFNRFEESLH